MIRGRRILTALLLLALDAPAQAPLKHLYLANDTHTDLLWNGDEEEWTRWSLDMARFYLRLGESTKDAPPEARSKWNYDAAWTLYMLEQRLPEDEFRRIIDQIRRGQASVPFNFTLAVYGASTLESTLRSFYYGGRLERKYGLDLDMAVSQENVTLPLGLASLWAGSGARYSWRGVCNCATKIDTRGPRDREIYWYTGLDGSRILMKWYSNSGWNAELGGYAEMLEPFHAVRQMDSLCGSARHPYLIAGAFGKGWDNIHNYSYDLVWGLGRRTLPGTRLHLSNQVDFFRHFESLYGDSIPEVRVSHGNEWDLNPASLAEVSAQLRRSMEKLRTAEAMAALVTSGGDSLLRGLDRMKRDFLYGIGVYNLHGWTADGPVDRRAFAAYMRRQQRNVSDYVDALHLLAAEKLGEKIDPGPLDRVHFVFNSLSWERDGMVDVRTDGDFNAAQDLESGEILRGAVVEKDGATHLRIRVERVPPVGYRLIRLVRREGKGAPGPPDPFRFSRGRLETPHYRVRLSRSGAILSLADRAGGKEWAEGPLNDLGAARFENGEPVRVLERGAECITLLCRSDDPVRHECAVTFHARDPRVDFRNRILGNFSGPLHWTFAFNVDRPDVRHEEVGAVLLAKTESAGGHYADRMARTDYLTLNHFANAGNDRENVTLSNADCLFFRLGDSRPDFLDAGSSVLHVLAGGQVNENLGVFRQDGDTLFHQSFSLLPRSGPFDAGSAMRFSLEHQNPLFAGAATPGGEWAGPAHSFVRNDNPDVLLWALKPGEEGGLTMRWWNLESKPAASTVRLDRPIGRAVSASHVETDIAEIPCAGGAVPLDFAPQQIRTVRVPEY